MDFRTRKGLSYPEMKMLCSIIEGNSCYETEQSSL